MLTLLLGILFSIAFIAACVLAVSGQTWFFCDGCNRFHSNDGCMQKSRPHQREIRKAYCPCCYADIRREIEPMDLNFGWVNGDTSAGTPTAFRLLGLEPAELANPSPAPAGSRVHHVSEKSDQAAGGV